MKRKIMKILTITLSILTCASVTNGQGFVNLGFESAVIVSDPSSPYRNAVYAANAIPGWTATGFLSPDIFYNDLSLGSTSVSLFGPGGGFPILSGNYTIALYGGVGVATGASISQTGLVPADAASIQFKAQNPGLPGYGILLVSLGGQNISFSAVSAGPNYMVYGGDISAFAGQVAQLSFTAPVGGHNYWVLDDIQFVAVPEPNTYALCL